MRQINIRTCALVTVPGLAVQLWAGQPPASPVFYRTRNSQMRYSRVLVVDASNHPPHRISVASLDLTGEDKHEARPVQEYKVNGGFKTLQEAADAAKGGDLIAVMPGTYGGFVLEENPAHARAGMYISKPWVSRGMSSPTSHHESRIG